MAKGKKKVKSKAHEDEIERDRLAAHGLTHEQAIQGANLASGVPVEPDDRPLHPFGSKDESVDMTPKPGMVEEGRITPAEAAEEQEFTEELLEGGVSEPADTEGAGVEEGEEKEARSVVADKFKTKYIENARALGIPGKAAKRSNWDWLSQQIASACLDDKHKIRIDDFVAILDANGVDHSKWTNRNKGWEGRFRMTGRVALQKVVANGNVLKMPDGSELVPPAEFVERYKTKA
jgi:hypothetical protein